MSHAAFLKKTIEAIKELVSDANFDISDSGISLQAMDDSHVALVALLLRSSAFEPFRCDENLSLGISIVSLNKILKCSGLDDAVTIKADKGVDTLNLMFEGKSWFFLTLENGRTSEFDLKLMDIDSELLGIPDTPYEAVVRMSSTEFQRICRDLAIISESIVIDVSKEGIKFSSAGDLGTGAIFLKNGTSSIDDDDDEKERVVPTTVQIEKPVSLTFSLKYLINFSKATSLSNAVILSLSPEVPLLVEYLVSDVGHIRYYLAPKIEDDE